MDSTRKLWIGLASLLAVSFGVLLFMGGEIYRKAPPLPEQVRGASGEVIFTRADIEKGRQVWQSMGGMQLGSIWGHGGYVAPDWTADWVHREAIGVLCADAHAPSCEPRGRCAQYAAVSASDTLVTVPRTWTCRLNAYHGNVAEAYGTPASCPPLADA